MAGNNVAALGPCFSSSISMTVSPRAVVSSSAGGGPGTVVAVFNSFGSGFPAALGSSNVLLLPVRRCTASLTLLRTPDWTFSVSSGGGGGHRVEGLWKSIHCEREDAPALSQARTYVDESIRRDDICSRVRKD